MFFFDVGIREIDYIGNIDREFTCLDKGRSRSRCMWTYESKIPKCPQPANLRLAVSPLNSHVCQNVDDVRIANHSLCPEKVQTIDICETVGGHLHMQAISAITHRLQPVVKRSRRLWQRDRINNRVH